MPLRNVCNKMCALACVSWRLKKHVRERERQRNVQYKRFDIPIVVSCKIIVVGCKIIVV